MDLIKNGKVLSRLSSFQVMIVMIFALNPELHVLTS